MQLSGGGPIFGIVCGFIVSALLVRIHNDFVLEINTTVAACYLMFYFSEVIFHVSGILALVAFGLFMSYSGKTSISAHSHHALHHVWGYIGYCAETIIFILSGVIIGQRIVVDQVQSHDPDISYLDFVKLFAAYILLHVIRFSLILLFWPCLKRMGYGMSFN